ncbi:glycerophosphodiester phosphodiesterase [Cohnella panacarvi]|uniref:glycerophosphodiester phosphodiesterase n=1 Tax=Cohnella panacarvi TaxID=400776 RepID=UPI00047C4C52|nr:glycerophosphodiester phosphodiesterase [Cohnella panacarvi]
MKKERTWRRIKLVAAYVGILLFGFSLSGQPFVASSHMAIEDQPILTIAHRGASGYAPENTLSAFRMAVRMEADFIEIDLQLTKDGEIVIMHDGSVNRTTNGRGEIRRMTLADVKALDAGSWFNSENPMYAREEYAGEKVPTLRELFETFGNRTNYLLETKSPSDNPGLEEKMWALVEQYGLADRVAVQSFSRKSLKKLRKLAPGVTRYQLIWYNHSSTITREKLNEIKKYANGIGVTYNNINEDYVRKTKAAGLSVIPYTINDPSRMDRAVRWEVDGIHTDYPDRLRKLLSNDRIRRERLDEQQEETVRPTDEREYDSIHDYGYGR